jgi:hypothetical protein
LSSSMPRRAHTHSAQKVRFSRDGDQFHYSWAARRCLKLLSSASGLVAITIEGTSVADVSRKGVDAGTEVIDVAEYSGSEDPLAATSIRYIQLKHSTVKLGLPWPPGGLQKTLAGFAKRYVALTTGSTAKTPTVVQFSFVSNRPIGSDLTQTIEDAARGRRSRHPRVLKKLQTFTKLKGAQFSSFCRCLQLLGDEDNFLTQRLALAEDILRIRCRFQTHRSGLENVLRSSIPGALSTLA